MNIRRLPQHARFLVTRHIRGFTIPDKPQLDLSSSKYFTQRLNASKFYLEYGAGGSTITAARLQKQFLSVETDPYYMKSVRRKIIHEFGTVSGQLVHSNIGMTTLWGYPIFKGTTERRQRRYRAYAATPWCNIKSTQKPNLVLIDGRFRVLCALYSIINMVGHDYEMLVDDYIDRPSYREIERFASLDKICGRMAVFSPRAFDKQAICQSIERFSSDFR